MRQLMLAMRYMGGLALGAWLCSGVVFRIAAAPAPAAPDGSTAQSAAADDAHLEMLPRSSAGSNAEFASHSAAQPSRSRPISDGPLASRRARNLENFEAATKSHKDPFYENEFDYVGDPFETGAGLFTPFYMPLDDPFYLGDFAKGRKVGDCMTLDVGGQYRLRFHDEQNFRGLGLTGLDDTFLLHRVRLYGDLEVGENFRCYAEYLDANSEFEFYTPRPIEENRSDMINLFGDAKLWSDSSGELWARVGRQELLYGDQRVVSPLDWANTRRTFDGAKVFWRGDDWNIDGFWTRPVYPDTGNFDEANPDQEFYGLWATYRKWESSVLDLFYLNYSAYQAPPADFRYNTFGSRWAGDKDAWLWTAEGAYQFGEYIDFAHSAGFYTLGIGRRIEPLPWQPTIWAYYDWASGSNIINNGYHHLFPLAHKYLGFMDLYGRRNIEDWNFLLTATPTKKVMLMAWWHIFHLQNGNDVPYSVVMTPEVPIPGGSTSLGQELDLLAMWNIRPRMNLVLGYSHFWAGRFYSTNPSPGIFADDADFTYVQWTTNF